MFIEYKSKYNEKNGHVRRWTLPYIRKYCAKKVQKNTLDPTGFWVMLLILRFPPIWLFLYVVNAIFFLLVFVVCSWVLCFNRLRFIWLWMICHWGILNRYPNKKTNWYFSKKKKQRQAVLCRGGPLPIFGDAPWWPPFSAKYKLFAAYIYSVTGCLSITFDT